MTPYKTLRDLPGCPAGTVFANRGDGKFQPLLDKYDLTGCPNFLTLSENQIKSYPDWFAEVKEPTLMEAVGDFVAEYDFISKSGEHREESERDAFKNLRDAYNREKEKSE